MPPLERKRLEELLRDTSLNPTPAETFVSVTLTRGELEELVTGYTCLMALSEILGEIVPKKKTN